MGRHTAAYSVPHCQGTLAWSISQSRTTGWCLLRSLLPLSLSCADPMLTRCWPFVCLIRIAREGSPSVSYLGPAHRGILPALPSPVGNFQSTLSQTIACQRVPFDFSSSFVSTYFGPKQTLELDYFAFTQLLQVRVIHSEGRCWR